MRALLLLLLAAGDPRAQLEALKARQAAEAAAAGYTFPYLYDEMQAVAKA